MHGSWRSTRSRISTPEGRARHVPAIDQRRGAVLRLREGPQAPRPGPPTRQRMRELSPPLKTGEGQSHRRLPGPVTRGPGPEVLPHHGSGESRPGRLDRRVADVQGRRRRRIGGPPMTRADINRLVDDCVRYWRETGLDPARVDEMRLELTQHLEAA